jgi:hypothetical protein
MPQQAVADDSQQVTPTQATKQNENAAAKIQPKICYGDCRF